MAQTISYEIRLALIIIVIVLITRCFGVVYIRASQRRRRVGLVLPYVLLLWLVRVLAETNRTPFDFAEGERELVSGFNVEYGGGGFALLFIAEYGIILFFSFLTTGLFITSLRRLAGLSVGTAILFFW